MSLFSAVQLAPRDQILGLNETFNDDVRKDKVNLGIGVYTNESGKIPLLRAVRDAEKIRVKACLPHGYLPIDGISTYNEAVQKLLLGSDSLLITEKRVVTVQTLGGTGALKIGADFLRRINQNVSVAISNPSWENHRALFETAGFNVVTYPYYNAKTNSVNFDAMMSMLNTYKSGTIIVFHACCHNPTGIDLTDTQWLAVANIVTARNLIPFIDIPYQGFSESIEKDASVVRLFSNLSANVFIASSFSKSFSLYGERIGALSIITNNKDETVRVLSQLKRTIRTNYSNPPTYGGAIVSAILTSEELNASWIQELSEIRNRIQAMRNSLVKRLKMSGIDHDFSFINTQRGMFSYSGLTPIQIDYLRKKFAIYAVNTGRICIAALNTKNLDFVAQALASVIKMKLR
ncbi:MAG: amino acid aminotransferase [Burkholderia sp.]|nr:amino acid aminotransferase [Burkholderia sp.]